MFVALLECCTSSWAVFSFQLIREVYENIPEVIGEEWKAATSDTKANDCTECAICVHTAFQATSPITYDAVTDPIEIGIPIPSVDKFKKDSESIHNL